MKLLKQRFTQWFNARSDRKGTPWESRFRIVLVEGAGRALSTMAAYIDLNAVRVGIVSDPRDYPWCGYGLTTAGEARAREGIQASVKVLQAGCGESLERSLEAYRERFGPRRRTGARRMRGLAGEAVFVMRDLRLRVFG